MTLENKVLEVYETSNCKEVNDYLKKLGWVLLQTGTKFNKDTKELTVYYSLGKLKTSSDERW